MNIPPVSPTVPNTPVGPVPQVTPPAQKDADGDHDGTKVKPSNPGLGKVADHSA